VGTAILDIVTGSGLDSGSGSGSGSSSGSGVGQDAYLLTAAGLSPAP
jgi:hypothetical protein